MCTPVTLFLDLDGTLLNTVGDLAASVNAIRAELGHDAVDETFVMSCIGHGLDNLLRKSIGVEFEGVDEADWLPNVRTRYRAHYAEHLWDHTCPYPGVDAGLATLQAAGHRMAVVSNKPEAFCEKLVDHFDYRRYFPVIIGGDSIPHRKPDPRPLHAAANRLGVDIKTTWMVGDSPGDIEAGQRAGCARSIAATWGYRPRGRLETSPHNGLIDCFQDLVELCAESRGHPRRA